MLPNRVSVNLFAGSLIINIITIGYTTRVPSFSFTGFTLVINLAEIVNPCLQLVIFSLLTMDYDGNFAYTLLLKGYTGTCEYRYQRHMGLDLF